MEINSEIITKIKRKGNFGKGEVTYYSLKALKELGLQIEKLPYSIRILLENNLRNFDGLAVTEDTISTIANWPTGVEELDITYIPSRVILQDFTGVPLLVDLADMREAMKEHGGDPAKINPLVPTDLVIDHSVQVDYYGTPEALNQNLDLEYKRNIERYKLIKWAQQSFENMRVVPPGSGIVHQVNLEYLSPVVDIREFKGEQTAIIDTIVGTDSHTPMINGLGVVGWGVGGIEAEANMLGQPYYFLQPAVIGVRMIGSLPEGATATDMVLSITELMRKKGVVSKFVEYFGPGLNNLTVQDRATISNMSPEMGCTISYFPVDQATLDYMTLTGRDSEHIKFVKKYLQEQLLFRTDKSPEASYSEIIEFNLNTVVPSLSGPNNPEERVDLADLNNRVSEYLGKHIKKRKSITPSEKVSIKEDGLVEAKIELDGKELSLKEGDVVIAAITSCTNTSNPAVLIGAGLIAKKAVNKGLKVNPYVKTSLAPGSKVVTEYLKKLKLDIYLDKLGFNTVGYGCTTCIGNSGDLKAPIEEVIKKYDMYNTAVISGNRNFTGRVHNLVRGNFLGSPMLVVIYALAGTTKINVETDPIGTDTKGKPVFLKDLWPTNKEIQNSIKEAVKSDIYKKEYDIVMDGDFVWRDLPISKSLTFDWDPKSTYIRRPPYFADYKPGQEKTQNINSANVLVLASEKVSTDHISPAGNIAKDSPAGKYLLEHGIPADDFNTYGSRRGNHEVMVRGTFANVRLKNSLVPEKEGWWTKYIPTGEIMPIYDASSKYIASKIPLIVLGANQYGQGSSRDWAGKGPALLGVKAVIVEDFERIHRSNLIGMGVLPIQFEEGVTWAKLGLDGSESFSIEGLEKLSTKKKVNVTAIKKDGSKKEFITTLRLDTPIELEYYKNGGIMPFVVSKLLKN
jgi:aconitate hydratase